VRERRNGRKKLTFPSNHKKKGELSQKKEKDFSPTFLKKVFSEREGGSLGHGGKEGFSLFSSSFGEKGRERGGEGKRGGGPFLSRGRKEVSLREGKEGKENCLLEKKLFLQKGQLGASLFFCEKARGGEGRN